MYKFNDLSTKHNSPVKFSEITKELTDGCSIIFFIVCFVFCHLSNFCSFSKIKKQNSVMRRIVEHTTVFQGLHEGVRIDLNLAKVTI